jgi:hypothetical protein
MATYFCPNFPKYRIVNYIEGKVKTGVSLCFAVIAKFDGDSFSKTCSDIAFIYISNNINIK